MTLYTVVLTRDWTNPEGGQRHTAGTSVQVSQSVAQQLHRDGFIASLPAFGEPQKGPRFS